MNGPAFFTIAGAWAATGSEAHPVEISDLIFPLINFLIFLFLIKRFVVPLLRRHMRERRAEILAALQSAAKEKADAETLVSDYRERMDRVETEARDILDGLRAEAEREKDKLIRDAREISAKLREDANFLTQQEQKVARQQIREEIARVAQATAERTIRSNFQTADQDLLVDRFLQQIEAPR